MKSIHPNQKHPPLLRNLFTASIAISLLLTLCLAISKPSGTTALLAIFTGILLAAAWWTIPSLQRWKKPVNWFLSIAILNLLLVVPELILRIADFRYESGIQFGYPRPTKFLSFKWDSELFWTHDPTDPDVNSLGFREKEILPDDKPADSTRVLYLGDSCTDQGYPKMVEAILNEDETWRPFECITLAIPGYSSFQGCKVAELYGHIVNPDIVVVYYGWNDHWLAYGAVDSRKDAHSLTPSMGRLRYHLFKSRLVQFIHYLVSSHEKENALLTEPRVSLKEYESNLISIYRIFDRLNATVVFITAPTSHYTLGVPDLLIEQRFLADKASGIRLHQSYNAVVRKVQKTCPNSFLCDLEAKYREKPNAQLKRIFRRDGIHFSERGLMDLARNVSQTILQVDSQTANPSPSESGPS